MRLITKNALHLEGGNGFKAPNLLKYSVTWGKGNNFEENPCLLIKCHPSSKKGKDFAANVRQRSRAFLAFIIF